MNPLPPPGRHPCNSFNLLEGLLSEASLFHGNEPLGGGPEDNRLFATPAVRIGVSDLFDPEKSTLLFQKFNDSLICLKHELPLEFRYKLCELSVVIDRSINFEAILKSYLIVVFTMAGSNMHYPASLADGYEIAEYDFGFAVDEGMLCPQPFEFAS